MKKLTTTLSLLALLGLAPLTSTHALTLFETLEAVKADSGEFSTLIAALKRTGLDAVLDDPAAELTGFVPTDEAFAALGLNPVVVRLLPKEILSAILLYHVAPGVVDSSVVLSKRIQPLEMVGGGSAIVRAEGPKINAATIVQVDILADNGIAHVIDKVLINPLGIFGGGE